MNPLVEKISDAEAEIMKVIWEAGQPVPFSYIRTKLAQNGGVWESPTINTMINRLVKKEVLRQEKKPAKRQRFLYAPNVSEQDYNDFKTQTLLHKVYKGNARDLLSALVDSQNVTEDDLDYLREYYRRGGDD